MTFIASFTEVVRFHGHRCPGLALGYRASEIAMHELGATRSEDEELVCIVENDACGVDAIQYLTGCTLGKGNLIIRHYGKSVYTFINRKTGDAVRIAQRPDFSTRRLDSRAGDLRQQVATGMATPEEREEYRERMDHVIAMILQIPPEGIFGIRHVHIPVPETARIFTSIPCSHCRELVAEPLTRVHGGRVVCIPCANAAREQRG